MRRATLLAVLTAGALSTSCISIKSVDDEQVPASWRQAMSPKPVKQADVNGRFSAAGQVIRSDGKVESWLLVDLFFPGRFLSRHKPQLDYGELHLAETGQLTFSGYFGGAVVLTETFDTKFDPETGALVVKSIPVSDKLNKFGRVAYTRSARLQIGSDHGLYAHVWQAGAGIVLFMPAAGTASMWARWDTLPH
jgi:hypothetical protein